MTKKRSVLLNIIALTSLVVFGYLLFFTIYHQMVNQNEGFFYVLVFGGILILAFVLLSLVTKLIAISRDNTDSFIWIIMEILFVLGMSFLYVRLRTSYSSSIPAEESDLYKAATLIHNGTLSVGGMDIYPKILSNPAIFYFSHLISIVFQFTGVAPEVMIYLNTVLGLLCALLVYLITKKCGDTLCSLIAFAVALFMPSMGFSVYNYDSGLFISFVLLLALYLSIIPIYSKAPGAGSIVATIFAGLVWGLCIAMDPVCILGLVLLLAINYRTKEAIKFILITFVLAVLLYLGLAYLESVYLETEFAKVFLSGLLRFSPVTTDSVSNSTIGEAFSRFNEVIDSHQKSITDNYYFLTKADGTTYSAMKTAWVQLGNQLLYMFLLVLSIACAFYMIRSCNPRIMPILSMIIASFIVCFLCNNNELHTNFILLLLIMSGSIALAYMYDNHHALADKNFNEILGDSDERPVEEHVETEEEKVAFMLRSQALIFVGANEEEYSRIKNEEKIMAEMLQRKKSEAQDDPLPRMVATEEKRAANITTEPIISADNISTDNQILSPVNEPIEFLENPLPLPPEHVPKELDFDNDFEVISSDLDFDFDYE